MNGLITVVLSLVASSGPALKCGGEVNTFPGYDPGAPIVIVDDRVLGAEGLDAIGSLDPGLIEVSCWNPDTGEIGVSGIHLVRVITKAEHRDVRGLATKAIDQQLAARRETGEFLRDWESLELGDLGDIEVRFDSDGATWSLVLEARFQRCEISSGAIGEGEWEPELSNACGLRPEEQAAALGKAYDEAEAGPPPVVWSSEVTDLRHLGAHSEIGVYSAVLRSVRDRMSPAQGFVLRPSMEAVDPGAPLLGSILPDDGLRTGFANANQSGGEFLPSDADRLGVTLFDRAQLVATEGGGSTADFWRAFRDAYGAGARVAHVTRPGFSADGETAVIYYGWSCGGRCGQTHLAVLSRLSGQWTIIKDDLMLIF